jgi:hypothetical protein
MDWHVSIGTDRMLRNSFMKPIYYTIIRFDQIKVISNPNRKIEMNQFEKPSNFQMNTSLSDAYLQSVLKFLLSTLQWLLKKNLIFKKFCRLLSLISTMVCFDCKFIFYWHYYSTKNKFPLNY